MRRLTTSDFVQRAVAVHGDRYDYSKVEYQSGHDKVRVRCPQHGEFDQVAGKHLAGMGCPQCGLSRLGQYNKKSTSDFIRESMQRHGDAYDYTSTDLAPGNRLPC